MEPDNGFEGSSYSSSTSSFALRRRIGARAWRRLHWLTYGVFALATVHCLAAGTDSARPWALALYGGAVPAVTTAGGWGALVPATKEGNTHVPDRDRPLAVTCLPNVHRRRTGPVRVVGRPGRGRSRPEDGLRGSGDSGQRLPDGIPDLLEVSQPPLIMSGDGLG